MHRFLPFLVAGAIALGVSAAPALAGSDGCSADCRAENAPARGRRDRADRPAGVPGGRRPPDAHVRRRPVHRAARRRRRGRGGSLRGRARRSGLRHRRRGARHPRRGSPTRHRRPRVEVVSRRLGLLLGVAVLLLGVALLATVVGAVSHDDDAPAARHDPCHGSARDGDERRGRRARAAPRAPRACRDPGQRRDPLDRRARAGHQARPQPRPLARGPDATSATPAGGRAARAPASAARRSSSATSTRRRAPRSSTASRELRRGDKIVVVGRDGSRVRFTVEGSEQYPKDDFPTARVYGRTNGRRSASSPAAATSTAPPATTSTTRSCTRTERSEDPQAGGRSLRMRSSALAGKPRPSRLLVSRYSQPPGPSTTVRRRP